jgi:hypothetical protein
VAWSVRPDGIVDFLNQRWIQYSGLTFTLGRLDSWRQISRCHDLRTQLERDLRRWVMLLYDALERTEQICACFALIRRDSTRNAGQGEDFGHEICG